jgi:hypothetical protein
VCTSRRDRRAERDTDHDPAVPTATGRPSTERTAPCFPTAAARQAGVSPEIARHDLRRVCVSPLLARRVDSTAAGTGLSHTRARTARRPPGDAGAGGDQLHVGGDARPAATGVRRPARAGGCEFPTPGFVVTLRRHTPQGFNPRILLLDKVVRPATGVVPQVVTRVEVRYEEATTAGFDAVAVLPDGDTVPVEDAV